MENFLIRNFSKKQVNSVQILPHILKFSELCENRDQFHSIQNIMNKLYESIPKENAVAHQVLNSFQKSEKCSYSRFLYVAISLIY